MHKERQMRNYTSAHALMAGSMMSRFGLVAHARFDEDEMSLADLAGLDVSGIDEIRFETLPQGSYSFEVMEAELVEGTDKDQAKRFEGRFSMKIIEVLSVLEAGVDKESLVGKSITERFFISPTKTADEIQKAIGRLRAFVTDMGCDSTGALGTIIENTIGHKFNAKIAHRKDPEDKSIVYARLKLDPKKR
jgi:hypothetical protein